MTDMAPDPGELERQRLVSRAVTRWRGELMNFATRNPLLYFRDLKVATFDLAAMPQEAFSQLLAGDRIDAARLREATGRPDTIRRLRTIHRKICELNEEHGVRAGYLALGMASWDDAERSPAAPVLLYPVEIAATSSRQDDFTVALDNEPSVNSVLIEYLAREMRVPVSPDHFPIPPHANPLAVLDRVVAQLRHACKEVNGFDIQPHRVLAAFNEAKLPMVSDLEAAGELLWRNDVVAAIAGDPNARQALSRKTRPAGGEPLAPAEEFLVLDADSQQSEAVTAAANGHSLVISGPPGTGKSQTIANLIATLIARGQRVLFVAEKRAAIDTVVRRLATVGLDELVLDARDGVRARDHLIAKLKAGLESTAQVAEPDTTGVHRELAASCAELAQYHDVTHSRRPDWELSVFELECMLRATEPHQVPVRFDRQCLERLAKSTRERVTAELGEYAAAGGFTLAAADTPWWGAQLGDPDATRHAMSVADLLARTWPEVHANLREVERQVGGPATTTIPQWNERLAFLAHICATEQLFGPDIWASPLTTWIAGTATARWRKEREITQTLLQRRQVIKTIRRQMPGPFDVRKAHEALVQAADQAVSWRAKGLSPSIPFLPDAYANAVTSLATFESALNELATVFPELAIAQWSLDTLRQWLERLSADRTHPPLIELLLKLRGRLEAQGLTELLTALDDRDAEQSGADAAFRYSFAASLLDHLAATDPRLTAHRGQQREPTRRDFARTDCEHIGLNAQRVRHRASQALRAARAAHPQAERFLQRQWESRRNRASMHKLFADGGDVLLALTPCVAMSPLVVSRQLPARRMFDVVVIDEASQITVADAIPAIMRAERVVVSGDSRQLPPARFLTSGRTEPGDTDPARTRHADPESILDSLDLLLESRPLTWHYRSRDERLVSFANRRFYQAALTTFPGSTDSSGVGHVLVTAGPDDPDPARAEVRRVVELIVRHARTHPGSSLGVVTLSVQHAEAIRAALEAVRRDRLELDQFFRGEAAEPFFIKNLERVQGDERDVIIMPLGYHKGPDGELHYRFGPLSRPGGERRLNVAVTRAKSKMITVSTFASADLDPARLNTKGAKLLRDYLVYAESGGSVIGLPEEDEPALNPFETDVMHRVQAIGIPLIARYGASVYRVAFAAPHPHHSGRMVLAIESDGGAFHAAPSVRDRDRLRPQVLRRLGWSAVHRIWSAEWWRDPEAEVAKVETAYREALRHNDSDRPPAQRTAHYRDPATASPQVPCPVTPGRGAVTDYSPDELRMLLDWIAADRWPLTDDELRKTAMATLGFKRRGNRIDAALDAALRLWRANG